MTIFFASHLRVKLLGMQNSGQEGLGRSRDEVAWGLNCIWGRVQYNQKMELAKGKQGVVLSVKSITWYKDSHSLFDYESNKINANAFSFPLSAKSIALYRKRQSCNVMALDEKQEGKFDPEEYQFLTKFEIKPSPNGKYRLHFFNNSEKRPKKINSERLNTDESNSVNLREEETYLIVRKQKDANGEPKGYLLEPGQTIKLGRVEFFVSEVSVNDNVTVAKGSKDKVNANKPIMKYIPEEKTPSEENTPTEAEPKACKICLEDNEEPENFLFNPCKCSGSCGTVHLECLLQWIRIKVKKEVVGGTLHYNFQKFECEVCRSQLPVVIETEEGKLIEMLPIEKPKGNYLILQGACEKTKSVMMIKNVPEGGIKLGRGHDCEIRITDISVSRNHALIKFNGTGFYIFDNKSKFGTLVKEDNMNVEVSTKVQQGIQIGRTVVILDICKESELKERRESERELSEREKPEIKAIGSKRSGDRR